MSFKKNMDKHGKVTYKSRLVAKGYTQVQGINYDETFSWVVRYTSLRIPFALAAKHDLEIFHLDLDTSFLHGELKKEEIYL